MSDDWQGVLGLGDMILGFGMNAKLLFANDLLLGWNLVNLHAQLSSGKGVDYEGPLVRK